jgi:hypothetical protein
MKCYRRLLAAIPGIVTETRPTFDTINETQYHSA